MAREREHGDALARREELEVDEHELNVICGLCDELPAAS